MAVLRRPTHAPHSITNCPTRATKIFLLDAIVTVDAKSSELPLASFDIVFAVAGYSYNASVRCVCVDETELSAKLKPPRLRVSDTYGDSSTLPSKKPRRLRATRERLYMFATTSLVRSLFCCC